LPLVDEGSACTTLTVTGSGNAADVRIDLAGHDEDRFALRATLAHGGQTEQVFDVGDFPRDRGVFSLDGRPLGGFRGNAQGEWRLCIVDTEPSGGEGTLDTWSIHD
jgi:hypothetical protein